MVQINFQASPLSVFLNPPSLKAWRVTMEVTKFLLILKILPVLLYYCIQANVCIVENNLYYFLLMEKWLHSCNIFP